MRWLDETLGTAYLLLPLLGGAVVHGACMRQNWLACLAHPIDGGRRLGGRPVFGRSKTFRGPVCVAGGAAAVFGLQQGPLHAALAPVELVDYAALPVWLGAVLGLAAELAELPNSFVKRRLGVAPGGTARGPLAAVFYAWDQLDLLLGFWLAAAAFVPPTPYRVGLSLALAGGIHPLLTLAGYLLGMRPTAR
jgi:CDP-2,3-bis-(O-geranylgeranyl)-sn-glycerol synthase